MKESWILQTMFPARRQLLSGVLLVMLAIVWAVMLQADSSVPFGMGSLFLGLALVQAWDLNQKLKQYARQLQSQTWILKNDMMRVMEFTRKLQGKEDVEFVPEAGQNVRNAYLLAQLLFRKGVLLVAAAFLENAVLAFLVLAAALINQPVMTSAFMVTGLLAWLWFVSVPVKKIAQASYLPPLTRGNRNI